MGWNDWDLLETKRVPTDTKFNSFTMPKGAKLRVGNLTVHALGEISPHKPWMHDASYLFPLGFISTRVFWSYIKPRTRVVYKCEILEGEVPAQGGRKMYLSPVFRLTAMDDGDNPIIARNIESK